MPAPISSRHEAEAPNKHPKSKIAGTKEEFEPECIFSFADYYIFALIFSFLSEIIICYSLSNIGISQITSLIHRVSMQL
jgi:hypothetical protein